MSWGWGGDTSRVSPGLRGAFFFTGLPFKMTRPSSIHFWAAERVSPSTAADSTASARPGSVTVTGKVAVSMGVHLLLLGLGVEEQHIDEQEHHAHG